MSAFAWEPPGPGNRSPPTTMSLGVSAIGKVGHSYSQSVHTVNAYYQRLDAGELPIEKGFELSADDVLRRQVVMELMCSGPVEFDAINRAHGIDFRNYFAKELGLLQQYEEAGLIKVDEAGIQVSAKGRMFVRAIGMVFDKYLSTPTTSTYSKLI